MRSDAAGSPDVWRRFASAGALSMVAVALAAGAVAGLATGMPAAWSAFAGAALAGTFLMVGFVGLRLALNAPTMWQMPAALALYSMQIVLLLALWLEFERGRLAVPALDAVAFGLGALAATLVWQGVLVKVLLAARLSVDVALPGERLADRTGASA